ncbi:hypothetical protein PMSM_24730 [Paenibacillus macquariensis subsp. macquariensis]|uniref:RHS repeat-associated core domain-containing protein n=1 Tax=Paenibacillus macquariensis TaxID=948756 RepID=A0ABY1K8U4_9BACL|nr:hypothetical protein PMSM_24730 [Paenibacillus macquariensis subsp. macquariensis]SIR42526.1 RHS repeat-associated core domain-containing protein [Paenibacillus macquariensis]
MYDSETGLYYQRARYYDPSIGRFINKDRFEGDITNPLTLNQYGYVHNNPLTFIDPTGHFVWFATAAIGALVGRGISGASNVVSQLKSNGWNVKKTVQKFNKKELAISVGSGIVSGVLAGSGIGLLGSIGANAVISATSYAATQKVNHQKIGYADLAFNATIGGIAGKMGGAGALTKQVKAYASGVKAALTQSGRAANKMMVESAAYKSLKTNISRTGLTSTFSTASSIAYSYKSSLSKSHSSPSKPTRSTSNKHSYSY